MLEKQIVDMSFRSFISSKDAYMLIYVKKCPESKESIKPPPSPHALKVVDEMNHVHSTKCDEYKKK